MADIQTLSDSIHRVLPIAILVSILVNLALAYIIIRQRQRAKWPLTNLKLFADRSVLIMVAINIAICTVVLGLGHHHLLQIILMLTVGLLAAISFILTLFVIIERLSSS